MERAWFPLTAAGECVLFKGNPEKPEHTVRESEQKDSVRPPAAALVSQVQPQPSVAIKAVPPEKMPMQRMG